MAQNELSNKVRIEKNKQGGFISLDLLIGLVVMIGVTIFGMQWLQIESDNKINRATAEHAIVFAEATTKWIQDNHKAINSAATPFAQYEAIAVTKYLPPSFNLTNPYGQIYSIRVYKTSDNHLETLIITSQGEAISEQNIRKIAQQIGGKGGYISSLDMTKAQGSYGGWSTHLSKFGEVPGGGKLAIALFFQDGALISDYLFRSQVPGHPELNKMNTALDMGKNNIDNAGTISASKDISAQGNISVQNTLHAKEAHISTQVYAGGWFRTKEDGGWYSEKWDGGWHMRDGTWIRAYSDKSVYTGGQMQAGTVRANGRLSTGEYLQLDGIVAEGGGCTPNGLVGRNHEGALLSCQAGIWTKNGTTIRSSEATWKGAHWGECDNSCPPGQVVIGIKTYSGEHGNTGCGQGSLVAVPLCAPLR